MTVELFDTHCHLTFEDLADRCDECVAQAAAAGVTRLLTVACSARECEGALRLHQRHEGVWAAVGIHPHEASRAGDSELRQVAAFWRQPGVVAAGEMGLDYHYDFSPRDRQQTVFRRQLDLAAEAELPVIIHCREAFDDVVRILDEHGWPGRHVVFHCFSGTPRQAGDLRARGWWTSYTGVITFRNAVDMQRACVETPADQLMFETDAPYLSPEPVRKMRPNEPRNLVHTVRFAAALRGEPFDDLAARTTANALRFFGISPT